MPSDRFRRFIPRHQTGALSDAWDAAWDQAAEGAEFPSDEDLDALKASGARLAQKYVSEALPAIEPAAVEVPSPA